jgi:hypothetical protein
MNYYDYVLIWIYNHSLYVLLSLHFFMDFVFQSNNMATKKSTSNKWLLIHVACYSTPFLFFGIPFALINGLSHLVIDYVTSRISKKFWEAKQLHWFFVVIGFDQLLHTSILLWLASRFLLAF